MTVQAKKRGFGALDKDTLKKHASAGGRAAHAAGRAHKWDSASAKAAGAKGGKAAQAKKAGKSLVAAAAKGIKEGAARTNAHKAPAGANSDNPCMSTGDANGCAGRGGCNAFERKDGTPCTEAEAKADAGAKGDTVAPKGKHGCPTPTAIDDSDTLQGDNAMGSDKMGCGGSKGGCGSPS